MKGKNGLERFIERFGELVAKQEANLWRVTNYFRLSWRLLDGDEQKVVIRYLQRTLEHLAFEIDECNGNCPVYTLRLWGCTLTLVCCLCWATGLEEMTRMAQDKMSWTIDRLGKKFDFNEEEMRRLIGVNRHFARLIA